MLQMFPSVYKSYHHEDNNVILKKTIKTILFLILVYISLKPWINSVYITFSQYVIKEP